MEAQRKTRARTDCAVTVAISSGYIHVMMAGLACCHRALPPVSSGHGAL